MASRDLFIGRTAELNRLRKDVFFVEPSSYGHCYSLIGLNGIGKTALIRRLGEEFYECAPKNTYYFATVLEDGITFWNYWTNLLQRFSEEIDEGYITSLFSQPTMAQKNAIKKIKSVYHLVNSDPEQVETDAYRSQLTRNLDDLFRYYKTIGVRIIITIDEFDRAQSIFTNGQFFQRLFDLTPKGSPISLNLSIITISRRRVCTIAHHMQEGSNFEDAFPPLPLKGFNDEELATYFTTYENLSCVLLSKDVQKQILYLCGRSPGLLMGLRHEFEVMDKPTTDIGWVYAEHGQFIKNAYNRMITLMESTFADRAYQKPLLEVFIQKFIGPAYDDNFDMELPLLYDFGFVTKGTLQSNIFTMSGAKTGEIRDHVGNELIYEPIAPYFVEYIKHMIIPSDISNLSGLLVKAEKLIREVIEKEMKRAFPDTWEEIINRYAGKKDYYLETLQIKALQNDFPLSSISKLNVISFKEYYYVINDHWSNFSRCFKSYPSRNTLYATMSLLSESRNDSAHLNLIIYNGENRRKLRDTCTDFITCLENYTEPDESSSNPSDKQITKLVATAASVTFCCQAIKIPKGNLRGIIKEYGFSAGVAQRNLEAFGFASAPQVGDEFTAVVERWDSNAQMFNLKAPD